jgi:hypothetical protein
MILRLVPFIKERFFMAKQFWWDHIRGFYPNMERELSELEFHQNYPGLSDYTADEARHYFRDRYGTQYSMLAYKRFTKSDGRGGAKTVIQVTRVFKDSLELALQDGFICRMRKG